jgi:hypothetical protein
MRKRGFLSSTHEKKAMVGEIYLYLKLFYAVVKFEDICALCRQISSGSLVHQYIPRG